MDRTTDPAWTVTLAFDVAAGDDDGAMFAALFDACDEHMPSDGGGLSGYHDVANGKVELTFTLSACSGDLARSIAGEMGDRVKDSVLGAARARVTPA